MSKHIRSGKEILDDFFGSVEDLPGVDPQIAALVKKLYDNDKLTQTNLTNALAALADAETGEDAHEQD